MRRATILIFLFAALSAFGNDPLEKPRALRSNGLFAEAKRELVELMFAASSPDALKADALLMLGEIAVDEKKTPAARENWEKLIATYPDSSAAAAARAKLDLLSQIGSGTAQESAEDLYRPGTILVLPDEDYGWAHVEIAAAFGKSAVATDQRLADAVKLAAKNSNIVGIVQVDLAVDVPFESGRVVCYQPTGSKAWQKVVRMTYPGTAEAIAHRFINRLGKEVKDKKCP